MDGEDFIPFFIKVEDELKKKEEDKTEQTLLHIWGYQLPLMENPISFSEFKEKHMERNNPKPEEMNEKKQESHAEKINRIRAVEKKTRKVKGGN